MPITQQGVNNLIQFFREYSDYPTEPIMLKSGVRIFNIKLTIGSHLKYICNLKNEKLAVPYFNRLLDIKLILENHAIKKGKIE